MRAKKRATRTLNSVQCPHSFYHPDQVEIYVKLPSTDGVSNSFNGLHMHIRQHLQALLAEHSRTFPQIRRLCLWLTS
jgi:hypothetical protein